ncbi:STAS/SEC14 domain-containing protein [Ascidiimonas sp. W6]|uniref:STAS/SEC14 domain-containing protein n=1 Tax=Ascidiimonas meishanensis TaxID=3128903 RepID=UPI0030EEDBF0
MTLTNENSIKCYKLEIGEVWVYEDFMVSKLNEGIVVTLERIFELIGISEVHFRDRNFAYITIRDNSYSIDPTIYIHIKNLSNLKAFAIVSVKAADKHNFKIEKHFFESKPMRLFNRKEDAIAWVKKHLI